VQGFARGMLYLNLAAVVGLLFRLSTLGLFRIYHGLFFYLLVYALQFTVTAIVPIRTTLYGNLYMLGESTNVILSILVVVELVGLTLASHPALAVFGRKTVAYTMGLAALIATGGVMLDSTVLPGKSRFMQRFVTAERTMDFTILMFLLFITAFMMWFPVKVRRNIMLYIVGFVVFYLSRTFGLLMINLLPLASLSAVNTVFTCFSLCCLIAWLVGLRREGEDTTTIVGHRWNPAAMKRLSGQLDAINAVLVRFGRH
jgi:hypothetical protein